MVELVQLFTRLNIEINMTIYFCELWFFVVLYIVTVIKRLEEPMIECRFIAQKSVNMFARS